MHSTLKELVEKMLGKEEQILFSERVTHPLEERIQIGRVFTHLPYESYCEESQLFFNQGSTGFVLLGSPLVGASLDDQGRLAEFFRGEENLPEGTSLQVLLYASPKIGTLINYWKRHRALGIYQDLAERRSEFLKGKAFEDEKGSLIRDYRLLISYTLPGHSHDPMAKMGIMQVRQGLKDLFEALGLYTQVLDAAGLIREVGNILNFKEDTQEDSRDYNPLESISRQIPDAESSFHIQKDQVKLGEFISQSFIPKSSPKYWALGHMDKFLSDLQAPSHSIPCAFFLHYGLYVNPNQGAEKRLAFSKRESLETSLKNKLTKWQPGIEEQFEESQEVVRQIQLGERVVNAVLSYTIFCKPEQKSQVRQSLNTVWQNAGWRFQEASYDHFNLLLSSLPMMWTLGKRRKKRGFETEFYGCGPALGKLGITRKTITQEAQNMLPIVGEWKGQVAPGIPLTGRRGQLFFWNPFDGMLLPGQELPSLTSNYNFCISGTMGSGKSFLCNEMITTTLGVGGKAFVMDKGESFKNLCLILGGHHIDFDINMQISLNPFTHIPEGDTPQEKEERSEQLTALVQVVRTMAMPHEEPDSLQGSLLKQVVYDVWDQKKSNSTIDDIRSLLLKNEDSRAQDLGKMLWSFSSEGMYGKFFNPPATVNLNHDLVVVETQRLKDDLRAVMVQMMIVQVWQRMVRSDRKSPFLILIDEAWELIQGKSSGKFIESVARTARKYRGALGTATQNLTDYFKDDCAGARVAFENAAWKLILHQSAEVTTAMRDHPSLKEFVSNPFKEQTIRSLLPAKRFSEVVIFGQKIQGVVGRLFVDPYSALLYSTKAQDYVQIQTYVKQGLTLEQAIEAALQDNAQRKAT